MPEVIAELEIPETAAVAEATRLIQETTSPLIYHHSRHERTPVLSAHNHPVPTNVLERIRACER
jgi:hypothetical protein